MAATIVLIFLLLLYAQQFANPIEDKSENLYSYLIHSPQVTPESQQIEKLFNQHQIFYQKMKMVAFEHDFDAPRKLKKTPENLSANSKLDLQVTQNKIKRRRDLTWEHISRWQSHLQVYFEIAFGDALASNGPFMVVEEVANLTTQTLELVTRQILPQLLPSDWEIAILDDYFHTCFEEVAPRQRIEPYTNLKFCRVKSSYKLQGYLIRDSDATLKLVETMNTRFPKEMDSTITKLFEQRMIVAYAFATASTT